MILDWFVNPDHALLFTARYIGAYERAGLDVVLVPPTDPDVPQGAHYLAQHPDQMLARFFKDNPSLNDKLDIASWKALPGYFAQDPAYLDRARDLTYRDFGSRLFYRARSVEVRSLERPKP